MNEIQVFNNPDFGEVRTMEEDGAVLFCGSDVAKVLGYSNPRDALAKHCKGVVKRDAWIQTGVKSDGSPAIRYSEVSFIHESDLYRLVFSSMRLVCGPLGGVISFHGLVDRRIQKAG